MLNRSIRIRCAAAVALGGVGLGFILPKALAQQAEQPVTAPAKALAEGRYRPPPAPAPTPRQLSAITPMDVQVDNFIRVVQARTRFDVSGKDLAVAVIDTGVNPKH